MTTPVSGNRAGETTPSLDNLAGTQGAAPTPRATSTTRTATAQEANTVTRAPAAPPGADAPREFPTGTMDYYRKRHFDFVARNPGMPPPPYYLQYGEKYIQRFKALGPDQLSPEGLAWRDRALKELQNAIETLRKKEPGDFATLERDPDALAEFAYATHSTAYMKAGLLELPVQDLKTILLTPDLQDLLSVEGMKQIIKVGWEVRPKEMEAIVTATTSEVLRRDIQPKVEQLDRELKARVVQGWMHSGY
ncbi:hypothetical protein [Archangium lansingense]|uniref:Uncharacterized protein n=1 Tax=Archangium lansingense TaxID=2995310 RepID=A0ABT4ABA6_9BACT|nr:hypothetical protein [Archangium lansinium]MCY1078942.1 hypothetical protein [Archangium lansinium]